MTKKLLLEILIIFAFVAVLFILPNVVDAQCASTSDIGNTTNHTYPSCSEHYKCEHVDTVCDRDQANGNDVVWIAREQHCWDECESCGGDCVHWVSHCGGCYDTGGWNTHKDCEEYEVCVGGTGRSTNSGNYDCECKGDCLAEPANTHIEDGIGPTSSTNVFLPAKLGWNDVDGANSYWYRVWEATTTVITWETSEATTTGSSTISEAIPGDEPCTLQSTTSYAWKIAPCCSSEATECKAWDDIIGRPTFETSLAPEPVLPPDPDWNFNASSAQDVLIPVTLSWCNVVEEDYFHLKIYLEDDSCHPFLLEGGDCLPEKVEKPYSPDEELVTIDFTDSALYYPYFVQDSLYRWEVASCHREEGADVCSDYGQKWGLETENIEADPPDFNLLNPENQTAVSIGFPVTLSWTDEIGLISFNYTLSTLPGGFIPPGQSSITFGYPNLSLDTIYEWNVQGCFDYEGQNCGPWGSDVNWEFKTTGAPPTLIAPDDAVDPPVLIPVKFVWNDVGGAESYKIQISEFSDFSIVKEFLTPFSQIFLDHPDLEMNKNYWWQVKTCIDDLGRNCGDWSMSREFKTFDIGSPALISPGEDAVIEETMVDFSWETVPGAKAYRYMVVYHDSGEEIFNKIVHSNSVSHSSIEFPETGFYDWKVQACLDTNCSAYGDWSNNDTFWSFNLNLIAPVGARGGLVPCGRIYDDPTTPNPPFDERESCQIKHLFILLRNVLDFLFWKVATVLLALILLATGALFYVSMGDSAVIFKVKSFMKSAVIGYLVIFFAWFFINLLLALLGYKFQIFGNWWELPI